VVETKDDLLALATEVAAKAEPIAAKGGSYLHWRGAAGEELWMQLDRSGDLIGMNPHFAGPSTISVGIQSRLTRKSDTPLEGAFHCWANPSAGSVTDGDYPFVFDCPDPGTYAELLLPGAANVQVAAFAHEVTLFESEAAYTASQENESLKFASKSFIPSGLFSPDSTTSDAPEAMAVFTGHVVDASVKKNSLTSRDYHWALVDTLGGRYDVVIDAALINVAPAPGSVIQGSFWLSGRLLEYPRRKQSWFRRVLG
jgi:hypothetical protein